MQAKPSIFGSAECAGTSRRVLALSSGAQKQQALNPVYTLAPLTGIDKPQKLDAQPMRE